MNNAPRPDRTPVHVTGELLGFGHTLRRYLTEEIGFDPFEVEGLDAYIVGGAFRDHLSGNGLVANDIDLSFSGELDAFEALQARIADRFGMERIDIYKPHNWVVTPERCFDPGVDIQISRHPAIDRFFELCSESMNAFLYDGTTLLTLPQAFTDAGSRSFEMLNLDLDFTPPARAQMMLDRVEKFRARGYIYRRNEMHDLAEQIASEA